MATELNVTFMVLTLLCCGCLRPRGIVFSNVTVPYYLPYAGTTVKASKSCRVDITQLKEPFSRAGLSVMWTNKEVKDAMLKSGMSQLNYADIRTLSILNGVYQRQRIIFYGE